jgi:hypothetical protein
MRKQLYIFMLTLLVFSSCQVFKNKSVDQTNILDLSYQILSIFETSDFKEFDNFIHPKKGVQFSPYAYISNDDLVFKKGELSKAYRSNDILEWGSYDGTGNSMKLTVSEYFSRFVLDRDFSKPDAESVNKFIGGGNSLNNLEEVYPECDFVEFYSKGKNDLDWRCLRLVYEKIDKEYFLVGIVHDEWTI